MAGKIRIYSKKAFAIGPGAIQGSDVINSFITVPMSFQDMPAEFVNDPTFLLAQKCGDIVVIDKNNQKKIENQEFDDDDEGKGGDPNAEKVQNYYEKLKAMKSDEVEAEANKYGAEFDSEDKLKNNKKRVLEAYKIWIADGKEEADDTKAEEE